MKKLRLALLAAVIAVVPALGAMAQSNALLSMTAIGGSVAVARSRR